MSPTPSAVAPRVHGTFPRVAGWIGATAWVAATAAGLATMARYSVAPGALAAPPATWPGAAPVALDLRRGTLLLFAHPHCVCTRATLAELERIAARAGDRLAAHVFFYADPALGTDWSRSATWQRARAIPGVNVHDDPLAAVARAHGASTSGTTVLYGPDGALRFHGGITGSRGHEGDNPGAAAVVERLLGRAAAPAHTPVYGCGLVATAEVAR
jgi:hypothetical protein